jgi:Type II CAAX prenyl endopeptidase Rce1-like
MTGGATGASGRSPAGHRGGPFHPVAVAAGDGGTPRAVAVLSRPVAAVLAATAGCVLLTARPLLLARVPEPVPALVAVFVALLTVGALWPVAAAGERPGSGAVVLGVGLAAFGLGRLLGGGDPPAPLAVRVIALNSLAAVAEEAFFRRFVYAVLLRGGAGVAVVGSAALFAVVHVTVYGAWVLPIDLAAGLVLSWQRWASGSWRVPALTHVLANVLVVV